MEQVNCVKCGQNTMEVVAVRYEKGYEYKTVVCYMCGHRSEYAYPLNVHHKFYVKEDSNE